MSFQRYVALGDSFTEGVGDPDPTRPNGVRGWADRVAEVLADRDPGFGYANLAIRGRKLLPILAEQLEPALALEPDLVTVYAGANDILRPSVDVDMLVAAYDDGLARLAAAGARVVVFTAFDPGGSATYRLLRGRFALYNELVREAADRHGATVVDFWRMREYRHWGYWDEDRMHMGPAGHQRMAVAVLDTLGVEHDLAVPDPREITELARREQWRQHATWVRDSAAPWVHRRLTGRSSGDGLDPRWPTLARPPHRTAGHTGRADVAQLVERDLPKVDVASSSLVIRSTPGTSYGQDVPSLRTYDVPRPPPRLGAVEFQGFPVAALDFYDDLEVDNTKSFWEAHKHVYAESVRAPMTALCASLEPEFGKAKIFRPYRDVRFAKDKTPYKTHQGAYVGVGPAPTTPSAPSSRRWSPSSRAPASRSAATPSRPTPAASSPTTRASRCCGTRR